MNLILLSVLLSLLCKIAAFLHIDKKASFKYLRFSEFEGSGLDTNADIRMKMFAAKLI